MEKPTLTVDGRRITAESGMTILEAALAAGIYIPHLCHHPDLKPVGVCRVCMVEVDGRQTPSCITPADDGMTVQTESEALTQVRRIATELLIANHHVGCLACAKSDVCELQRVARYVGITDERLERLRRPEKKLPVDTSNPFFNFDPNQCILCGICVRTCDEIVGVNALDYAFRGFDTVVSTFGNKGMKESRCVSCGECVARCPVGALMPKVFEQPTRETKTTCPYCGVGCTFYLGTRGNRIVNVRVDRDNPANSGRLCVKGRFGHEFVNHPERLTTPLIKKNGKHVAATWDEALELIASKLPQYKGDSFAAFSSAKCTNEDNYIIQKFTRLVMGTNNVDHCARLCHAPTVPGLIQSIGSGAMTNSIGEIRDTRCIFAIGTNTTAAHPVISLDMKEAVRRGAKMIVANPKRIELTRHACLFLQFRAGTDVALMMGMMRVIVDEGLHDEQFIAERCTGFEEFKASLAQYDLDFVSTTTMVPKEKIVEAARIYATTKPGAIFYAMGITQHTHGTDNVLATSNLALLTGNVGRPSSGVNPLRGQNNVQGACDMGALPNVYPGYQKVTLPEMQQKFQQAWGGDLGTELGVPLTEVFHGIDAGKIKCLYIVGENPVLSDADAHHVEEAIQNVEFFVSQDIFMTETNRYADVILPAATFAEKDGTFTNTERRVQRVRKAIEPVGESKGDWQIICEVAQRMGEPGFDFADASAVMDEIAEVAPIYGGISYDRIEDVGLQWPCPTKDHGGTLFLHGEKFATPDGKGHFKPLEYKPSAELPDREFPLLLTTDRSLYHFHTGTMTRRVDGLDKLDDRELLRIHPEDASRLGIEHGQTVRVVSRRGEVSVEADVTEICPPGTVSLTFHFAETPTNVLTNAALDPIAKIPETKVCAVRVEK